MSRIFERVSCDFLLKLRLRSSKFPIFAVAKVNLKSAEWKRLHLFSVGIIIRRKKMLQNIRWWLWVNPQYLISWWQMINMKLLSGTDVTNQVEIATNEKGMVAAFMSFHKFLKCSEKNGLVHFRCSFFKTQCKARLSVDAAAPLVKLRQTHNHEPRQKAKKEFYQNVVSTKRFKWSSSDSAKTFFVEAE